MNTPQKDRTKRNFSMMCIITLGHTMDFSIIWTDKLMLRYCKKATNFKKYLTCVYSVASKKWDFFFIYGLSRKPELY